MYRKVGRKRKLIESKVVKKIKFEVLEFVDIDLEVFVDDKFEFEFRRSIRKLKVYCRSIKKVKG